MIFRLSEEQRAFVGNVRKLAQSEFRARERQAARRARPAAR